VPTRANHAHGTHYIMSAQTPLSKCTLNFQCLQCTTMTVNNKRQRGHKNFQPSNPTAASNVYVSNVSRNAASVRRITRALSLCALRGAKEETVDVEVRSSPFSFVIFFCTVYCVFACTQNTTQYVYTVKHKYLGTYIVYVSDLFNTRGAPIKPHPGATRNQRRRGQEGREGERKETADGNTRDTHDL